jgi:hypothetical protein
MVIDFEQKAKHQERIILWCFNSLKKPLSPSKVHEVVSLQNTPLTSIRRAITNLTKQGKLRKTNIKVQGKYGRQEYCWERIN